MNTAEHQKLITRVAELEALVALIASTPAVATAMHVHREAREAAARRDEWARILTLPTEDRCAAIHAMCDLERATFFASHPTEAITIMVEASDLERAAWARYTVQWQRVRIAGGLAARAGMIPKCVRIRARDHRMSWERGNIQCTPEIGGELIRAGLGDRVGVDPLFRDRALVALIEFREGWPSQVFNADAFDAYLRIVDSALSAAITKGDIIVEPLSDAEGRERYEASIGATPISFGPRP